MGNENCRSLLARAPQGFAVGSSDRPGSRVVVKKDIPSRGGYAVAAREA